LILFSGLSFYYSNLGTMLPQKQGEETMMSSLNETVEREEREDEKVGGSHSSLRNLLWHGGSVYDAWFSCASNQVTEDMSPWSVTLIIETWILYKNLV